MLKRVYLLIALICGTLSAVFCFSGWSRLWGIAVFLAALAACLLLSVLYLVVSGFLLKKEGPTEKRNPWFWFLLRETCRIVLGFCRVRAEIQGEELLPEDGRYLLVCNHRSSLDPVAMIARMPKQELLFICKPEVFKIPAVGPYLTRIGYLTIDRENARNALATINEAARRIRELGYAVGIFPEGHRTKTGRLLPFHDGVFKIAQKAAAPVAVAVVQGSEKIRRRAPWRSTEVTVRILEVIPADEVTSLRSHQLADRVRQRMIDALPEEREEAAEN